MVRVFLVGSSQALEISLFKLHFIFSTKQEEALTLYEVVYVPAHRKVTTSSSEQVWGKWCTPALDIKIPNPSYWELLGIATLIARQIDGG